MTARLRKNATRGRLAVVLSTLALSVLAAIVYAQIASATVGVTAATGGTGISADTAANAASPSYTTLGNMVITEGANGDFAVGTGVTLILTAPANWEFRAGACNAVPTAGRNISANPTCATTTSTITVTLTVGGTNKTDALTISGINVRPTSGGGSMSSVNILRTAGNPGTATITGITNGTTNFGTLSMVAGALKKLQVLMPGESNAPGAPGSSGASGAPTAQTAGSAFNVTVNAVDQFWNLKNAVTDTVHLTSNDSNPTLAGDAALVAGTKSMSVTLRKAIATATVSASDVTNGAITAGTSSNLTVNPGPFTKLQLLVPGETAAPGTASGKTGSPSTQTAGSSFAVTANAVDANWNVVSSTDTVGITSSATYATLPANAALVAGTKNFNVTLKTVGSFTTTATDITNGTITANTSPSIPVTAGAFAKMQILLPGETADPGSATGKTGAPSARTAGSSFSVTVNAVDANWNVVNTVTDTAAISSSDGNFAPPANAALVAGTKTFTVSMPTAGSFTLTATDASDGSKTANTSPSTTVNAGVFAKLQLLMPGETAAPGSVSGKTGTPSARTAGSSFSVTVNAVDANWNPVSATDTIAITSSDANATLPANAALVAGTKTFTVTLKTAGSFTVTATDATDGAKTANTSPSTTVNAGAFTKLQLLLPGETASPGSVSGKTGTPSARTAGSSFSATVNAVDANWNVVSVADTVAITSTDANATLPANAALVAGTKSFSVTLNTVGSFTVTATDATDGAKTANTSPSTTVNAGAFTKLQLLLPGETAAPGTATGKTGTPSARTAGSSFSVTVNAVDSTWNPVSVADTVAMSSSDGNFAPPANAALVGGTRTFTVSMPTAGSFTLTATDASDGAKTANTSPSTTVNAGAFAKLQLLMPGETAAPGSVSGKTGAPSARTAGSSFSVTVNAVDANWNPVSASDTIAISSTDANATLPANAALVAGTNTFTVTLKTAGSATLTATDATDGAKTANTSPATTVNAGAFAKLQLLMPGETAAPGSASGKTGAPSARTAGSSFSVTVNAVDANWNVVSTTDTVAITSTDANATLPANAALVAGTNTFTVTLNTAGSATLTATDATDGAKTANTSPSSTVNAGAFAKLQLLMPGETAAPGSATGKTGTPSARTAGSSFSVTVNAVDAYWNPVSATDTIAISSTDANATPPANAALVGGTKTFTVTPKTAGSFTVTATDASDGAKTANTSPSTTVNAGVFAKLQLLMPGETAAPGSVTGKTGTPSARTAGSSFSVTVNAVDANWNPVSATDTVAITSTDPNATLPANAALVAGTNTFTVTPKTAGSFTVTATDATDGAKSADTSSATTVTTAAFAKLQLLLPGETAAPGTASGKTGSPTAETAGSFFTVTVNSVDAYWNPVSSTDTVAITSSDANAILPAGAALLGGTKNFNVTFKTAGAKTVTATDSSDGAKTADTSPATTVSAGAFTKLQLLAPGETAAPGTATGKTGSPAAQDDGVSFSVTVNAVDAYWNPVSATDTVAITSNDGAATLPANAALVAGTKSFTVTLNTIGTKTVTATDVSDGSKSSDTSPAITVQDITPPSFVSASANGTSLTITFDEALAASTPAGSAFTVVRNGTTMGDPTGVVVSGSTVILTLASVAHNGDTLTVAYAQPGSNRIKDVAGNETASFGAQPVSDGTPSTDPDVPTLTSPANGVTVATDTPTLSATFSDPDTNNTGQITFRVCSDAGCASVLGATFSSAGGIANGVDGSTSVPAGRITTDGTYYWEAKATDNTAASSAFSTSRSFVVDTTAPVLQTAAVNGTSLVLDYDEALDGASVPAALAYALHVNGGSAVTPTNVAISGSGVTLTFSAGTVHNGDAVTIDYTAGAAPVRDAVHNASSAMTGTTVTNNTTSLTPDVPTLTSPTAGARVTTLTPSLSATFSDSDPNNTGQITFKVCADSGCSTVLGTFTSAAGIVSGTDGSASVPGGTITVDGTYYWQAKATDNTSAASAYSSTRSLIVDTTAPAFASATVNGSTLAITFDEPLSTGSTPAGSAFVVKQNGSAQGSPTGVSVSGSVVTLTLATAVNNDDAVTVAYTQPGSGQIKDVAGNDAATFGAQGVTNNTASVSPAVPSLASPADGVTVATLTPSLQASFTDPDTNNTGQLTFRVCTDSNCTTVVSLFDSASGILNGGNGLASVPGGDLTTDGTYYWQAKAVDNHGAFSAFSSSRSFVVDTTPPAVPTIDSGPGAASTSGPDVSFAFSDTEGSATFEVNLDGIGWSPDTSPKAYTNLTDGSHTFQVRAIDTLGNTSAPRTRTWMVDAVAPAVPSIDSGPAAASTSGPGVSFAFSDTEGTATFEVQLDGGGYTSATSPKAHSNLSDGSHTFQVRALDTYGNTSSAATRTWTVDATAPAVPSIDSGPAAASTSGKDVSFGFSDSEGSATFEVQLDGGGYSSATSPKAYANLSDGSHTFQVRALDTYGNTSASTSRTWTVDAVAPAVPSIDSGPAAASTSGPGVSFAFSDTEGTATFEVQLDGGGYSSATTPTAYSNLSDGSHTFQVRALDTYGNTSSAATRTWTVDATAPAVPSIDSGPAAASTSGPGVSFDFSDTEGTATFEVQLDGGGYSSATSPTAYTNLSDGSHTFQVRALDAYGNTSASTSRTWTVDAVAPAVPSIDSGPASASTSGPGVSFGFSDTEGTATFEVQLDGGGYTSTSSPKTYTNLTQGSHTFDVRALDGNGNTSASVSRTWTVDAIAPTVAISSLASGAAVASSVSLTANANDTGGSGLATVTFEYAPTGTSAWTATPATWDTASLGDGGYDLRAIATDNAGNSTTSALVVDVHVDNHAPTVTLTAPQYVNAADPSSVSISATSPDTDVASVAFFECSNGSAACASGTWNPVSTDSSSPFTASWTVPGSDGNKTLRAVATDGASNTGASVNEVLVDRTAPAGGSVGYVDGFTSATSIAVSTTNGTDAGSSLDVGSALLERDASTLASGSCAAFLGSWSTVTSPDSVVGGTCYRYRYSVSDLAGNATTYTSANAAMVDTTGPTAVSLAYTAPTNASQTAGTVHFQQGGSGGFTVTATSRDPQSGIVSTIYPALGAGWTVTPSGDYTFNSSASAPGPAQTVTVTNGAGLSATANFTVTGDSTAPSTGSITYSDGFHTLSNVDLTLADGNDGGSGVDTSNELLRRAETTFSNGTCGSFGTFTTIATDPASSYTDSSVISGNCYEYVYVVSDRVGNSATYTSSNVVKVDADNPTGTLTGPGAYLRGTLTLNGSAADSGGSGVVSVAFQRSPAGGGVWTTIGTDASSPYSTSFDTTTASTPDGLYDLRVLVTDGAGNSASSAIASTIRIDNTAPLATLTDPGPYLRATVTLASVTSDAGSGVATTVYQHSPAGLGTWTTTPPAFDTTTGSTPDGLYDVRVLVTDNAGNQTIDTIAGRRVDNTPPAATMADPGTYVSGTVNLTSTSSDSGGSGIASVAFEKSAAGVGTYAPVPATWNTTPADDGLYDLRVVATDNAGNVATSAPRTNVRVDNTFPLVSITSPGASSDVTGLVTIAASSSDTGSGVADVAFAYSVHGSGTWTSTSAAWDTTALTDDDYDLRAIATDRAGNATISATIANVTVDNLAPTVSFTAPSAGQYINAASPDPRTLTANAGDAGSGVANVEFFACSDNSADCSAGSWTSLGAPDTTAPYSGSWPVPGDGNRALRVVATDNVGHTKSDIIDVTVDRTAPNSTILTKPVDPSNLAAPQFTFSSTEAASTFECKLDLGAWSPCATPDAVVALTDGTHTYSVRATDPAGNTDATPATWTWLADLTAPTGTLASPGANVRGTVTLNGSSSDPGGANASGVASLVYQYSTDGSTWVTTPAAWDTLGPPAVDDGTYELHIVVTDNAGNVFTSPAITNIRVDNTVPTTSIDDPGANLRGNENLTAAASDTGSGVSQVDFQASPAGAGTWASVGVSNTAPYNASFDTHTLTDGLYDFRTVATDVAGNVTFGAPVTNRRVDNTPPTATMGNPGTPLRSTVTLTSTTADSGGSGVATVQYQASKNGGVYLPVSASWNTVGSGDGTYDLRVVATDIAGNQTISAAVAGILVDNTAPSTTDDAPAGWQSAGVVVTLSPADGGSGVSTTRYSVDGGSWSTGTSVSVPAVDGAHTIAYYSVDVAGNIESQKSATVLVQASGPGCPTCAAADYLRDIVPLTASPTTTGAPITSVEFLYDATPIGIDTTAPYSVNWDTTSVADGTYDLSVVVTDAANNVSTIDLGNKVVDNTLPSAAVGAPLAGTLVSGSVSFSASASDAHLASVDYYVNRALIGSTGGAPVSWDTTSVGDGNATLYVVATDRSGNSRTSANVFVTVDNLAPTISLSAPSNASGSVTLDASASADTISVEFQRRSGAGPWTSLATDTSAPFQTVFDTTTVADGTYDLRAIATDGAAHTTTSAVQQIVIDNTLPSGSLATPAAGASVGGTVTFTANATDATSGVATVSYAIRTTGSVPFTTVGSASSAPWTVGWPTAGLSTGSYDIRLVITDRAGNAFSTAPVTVLVDSTPPGVQLENLGSAVTGSIGLRATTTGQGAARVVFGVSPAGSGRWTDVGTAINSPWSVSFDTTTLADGPYDFRATVYDTVGNSSTSVQTGIIIDNSAPQLVSSTPADGSVVEYVDSLQLVASETLASIASPLIDRNPAPAPVISGATATFNLGGLANGPHTLGGRLVDAVGKSTLFLLHLTIQPAGTPPADQAYVEKNTRAGQATTLTTAGGAFSVTMPANAWPATGGEEGDWIMLRIDPSGFPAVFNLPGFEPLSPAYDVTARWALAGNNLHTGFGRELVLQIADPTGKALPITSDGGGFWRLIPPLPEAANGHLPVTMSDAFYRDNGKIEILSRHLTAFALVKDVQAPSAPTEIAGTFRADGFTIQWKAGLDNSNMLGPSILYTDGRPLETVAAGTTTTTVAAAAATDGRKFSIVQTDSSGNASSQSKSLIVLPDLTGMTIDQARVTLIQRGFTIGSVTATTATNVEPGKIVSPAGRSAAVEGVPIDLVFSGNGAQTKLAFNAVGTKTTKASRTGHIAVRMTVSKLSAVTATLRSPQGKSLKVWHITIRAGVSIRPLTLPPTAQTAGRYRLTLLARNGKEQISKTIITEVVGPAKGPAKTNKPLAIVLVGNSALRNALAISLHSSNARILTTAEENATFLLTGNPALNVQAVVVDADTYTLSMVHDLRTVFPNLPIVALTDDPQKLARSVAAGATIALPRSTAPDQLAKVVRRLISH